MIEASWKGTKGRLSPNVRLLWGGLSASPRMYVLFCIVVWEVKFSTLPDPTLGEYIHSL